MKNSIQTLITILLLFFGTNTQAQTYEQIASMSVDDIVLLAATFGIPTNVYQPEYGVDAYQVIYEMPYLGETIEVSGALFIPNGIDTSCDLPIHTYMHGTIFKRDQAPSLMQTTESMIGYFMASPGYITLMPDYVGLGTSMLMHPYVHAQSEADAGIYMMQEVANLGEELGFEYNDELFISGYSQGGHSAMAMAQEIKENWSDIYEVTACAPMAGPYNISGVQGPLSISVDAYPNPAYFAYNVIGWNSYYGNIYDDLSEIFQEPYASMLPGMLDGETGSSEINAALPTLTSELLQPGIADEILNDPEHPYMVAAYENDVHNWTPECPMQIYYCEADDVVYPENALSAYDQMIANGAENVTVFNGGDLNHQDCAGTSILGGVLWLDQFHQDCVPESVYDFASGQTSLAIAPNPAIQGMTSILGLPSNTQWRVRDLTGRIISSGNTSIVELGKNHGVYFIEIEGHGTVKVMN